MTAGAGSGAGAAGGAGSDAGVPPAPIVGLLHRYSFSGTGSTACIDADPTFDLPTSQCAEDSISGRHGRILNTALTGTGTVRFTGAYWSENVTNQAAWNATAEYIDLLPNLLHDSNVVNLTVIVWFDWDGHSAQDSDPDHAYVFLIGSTLPNDNNEPTSFLYMTPSASGDNDPRAGYLPLGGTQRRISGNARATGSTCYALRVDETANRIHFFVDGVQDSEEITFTDDVDNPDTLLATTITDQKNWLGRSPISIDSPFIGTIDEFRVYNIALSNAAIQAHCASSPDTLLDPEP